MSLPFSAHPRAAASSAIMCARAELRREAVFERAARLSTHVSGRKTQMLDWRQRKGRRGGWREGGREGGIRLDVIRKSCCACQQRLALSHMPTRTHRYIYSRTWEQSH